MDGTKLRGTNGYFRSGFLQLYISAKQQSHILMLTTTNQGSVLTDLVVKTLAPQTACLWPNLYLFRHSFLNPSTQLLLLSTGTVSDFDKKTRKVINTECTCLPLLHTKHS